MDRIYSELDYSMKKNTATSASQIRGIDGEAVFPLQARLPDLESEIMKNWRVMDKPVVSICCTTYNHEDYIEDAIRGFLGQKTDFPFEIIIRDDCSSDKTVDVIKDYVSKYPNIIHPIYEIENTLSKGVRPMPVIYKKAVGEFFALCEGDDFWVDPLKLQKQVIFLRENKDYVITYSSVIAINKNGDIKNYVGGKTEDLTSDELQKAPSINTLTVCFRNVIEELPYEFGCTMFGDVFLWSLLGKYGKGKYLSAIKPSRYRMHEGGVFSRKKPKHRRWMAYQTSLALYLYYSRINNKYLSDYFHRDWLTYSFHIYGVFYYIRLIVRYLFKRIINR